MSIAFIDIEASSLNDSSNPIEVGWVLEDGSGESYLIRPEPSWTSDWAFDSAEAHGISRTMIAADGLPAAEVAGRLVAALDGHTIYSDAREADTRWLIKLLATAGVQPVILGHVYDAYGVACRPLLERMPPSHASSLAQSIVMAAEIEADKVDLPRHRAESDARRLWLTWRHIIGRVADVLDGWP